MYTMHLKSAKILIQYINELRGAEVNKITTKPKGVCNKRDGEHSSDFAEMSGDIDPTDYRKKHACHLFFAMLGSQY